MMGLTLLMELFDAIDEDILQCWNGRCDASTTSSGMGVPGTCQRLNKRNVLAIYANLARINDVSRYQSNDWFGLDHDFNSPPRTMKDTLRTFLAETQCADVLLTQKWLQNRMWHLCLTHSLLENPSHLGHSELSFDYATTLARETLSLCRQLRLSSIEVHGIGLVRLCFIMQREHLTKTHGPDRENIQHREYRRHGIT